MRRADGISYSNNDVRTVAKVCRNGWRLWTDSEGVAGLATRRAAAGTPIQTIKEWLGHRDIQTNMRYLAATAPGSEAAQKVTEAAFGVLVGE